VRAPGPVRVLDPTCVSSCPAAGPRAYEAAGRRTCGKIARLARPRPRARVPGPGRRGRAAAWTSARGGATAPASGPARQLVGVQERGDQTGRSARELGVGVDDRQHAAREAADRRAYAGVAAAV